jgi:hypothetical protein
VKNKQELFYLLLISNEEKMQRTYFTVAAPQISVYVQEREAGL